MGQVRQHLVVSEATFNRWQYQYGGVKSQEDPPRARWLMKLEIENARLKRLVAEKEFDIAILRQANDYLASPQGGGGRS